MQPILPQLFLSPFPTLLAAASLTANPPGPFFLWERVLWLVHSYSFNCRPAPGRPSRVHGPAAHHSSTQTRGCQSGVYKPSQQLHPFPACGNSCYSTIDSPSGFFHASLLVLRRGFVGLSYASNMGIPGLARRVEPYASHLSPQQLEGYSAIIDGPALAYYAHKLALAASGTPIRIPSYAAVVDQAIRWLNSLEHINIKV